MQVRWLWPALATLAVLVGLCALAFGQWALSDEMQPRWEFDPTLAWLRVPWMPRVGTGAIAIALGALVAAAGLLRWAPSYDIARDVPWGLPRLNRRIAAFGLIGVSALLCAALVAHVLLWDPQKASPAELNLWFMWIRPTVFVGSIVLGGCGWALIRGPGSACRLPIDVWDAVWIALCIALYVGMTAPFLGDPRWSIVGDEYSFLQVAYDLATGRPWDLFWQAGVYSTHPLFSSFIQSLTMRVFGDTIFGWKMGCVVMGAAVIPPTYAAARWTFDRTTAQIAAATIATSHYLFAYGNTGHNNIDSLLPVILTTGLAMVALTRPSHLVWYLAGAAAGFSFYFFFAARVAGPVLALAMLSRGPRRWLDGLPAALFGCALTLAPFLARNGVETFTRMFVESAGIKASFAQAVREALSLMGLSMLAFHWSTSHGLYISLGLLDPIAACLSALGIAVALLRFGDWRRRLLILAYLMIVLITGGLARHSDISVPRLLAALPTLAILTGDATAALMRWLASPLGKTGQRAVAVITPLVLTAALAGSNAYRFFVVTPSRLPLQPEAMWLKGLESPECRSTGGDALAPGHGRDGSIWYALTFAEPGRYLPTVLNTNEFQAVPEYADWPCIVLVDPDNRDTAAISATIRRRNSAAEIIRFEDPTHTRAGLIVRQPGRMPATTATSGSKLYSIHRTDPRRGAGPSAIDEPSDLAVDPDGHMFVTDTTNRRVVEYDRDGSFVRDWGTGAGLKGPAAVAAGGDVLAILDSATRRLILLGRDDRPIASGDYASLGLSLPKALAFAADGRLLVADEQAGLVMVFDRELRPGAHIGPAGPGSGSSTVRMAPTDVRVDRAGTIYVYEGNNAGRIRRFAADGTPMPVWDTGLQGGGRIAPVGDGSVWVSGRQEDGLRRIDASGARTGEIRPPAMVGGTGEGGVFGLAIDERGVFNVLWHYGGVISYRVPASG